MEANKFTAREKRVLMTWVFDGAWDTFCTPKYAYVRKRAFQITGCATTTSGKNDHLMEAPKESANKHNKKQTEKSLFNIK